MKEIMKSIACRAKCLVKEEEALVKETIITISVLVLGSLILLAVKNWLGNENSGFLGTMLGDIGDKIKSFFN